VAWDFFLVGIFHFVCGLEGRHRARIIAIHWLLEGEIGSPLHGFLAESSMTFGVLGMRLGGNHLLTSPDFASPWVGARPIPLRVN